MPSLISPTELEEELSRYVSSSFERGILALEYLLCRSASLRPYQWQLGGKIETAQPTRRREPHLETRWALSESGHEFLGAEVLVSGTRQDIDDLQLGSRPGVRARRP